MNEVGLEQSHPSSFAIAQLSVGRADSTRLARVTARNHGGRDDGPRVGDHTASASRPKRPFESTFATVRHRTIRSKGCLSNMTALAMVFKLIDYSR